MHDADDIVFEEKGYPHVDVDGLRKIHPGLMSFEDYFRQPVSA